MLMFHFWHSFIMQVAYMYLQIDVQCVLKYMLHFQLNYFSIMVYILKAIKNATLSLDLLLMQHMVLSTKTAYTIETSIIFQTCKKKKTEIQ